VFSDDFYENYVSELFGENHTFACQIKIPKKTFTTGFQKLQVNFRNQCGFFLLNRFRML